MTTAAAAPETFDAAGHITGQEERQAIDCELVTADNADEFGLSARQ
ncbi:hypothetical protein AB0K12_37375 [Nonomuraea sp. NPDC049419]